MSQSFSFKITLGILKLMGIKKTFSKDPIDFKKVRKQDVREPKGSFFNANGEMSTILKSKVTQVNSGSKSKKFVLFVHGGAFISGPVKHHWDAIKKISQESDSIVWMCDYPKAPENDIIEISNNIDAVYKAMLEKYADHQITLIGDSVGGTLITSLVQRLIKTKQKLPDGMILISPVMDATLSNPTIDKIEPDDPMLSKNGVLSAKKMCAHKTELNDPIISPLHGSFEGFPKTVMFIASHDITYPDQVLTITKMKDAKIDLEVIEGEKMPHIWPLLPVMKEAKLAFKEILNRL